MKKKTGKKEREKESKTQKTKENLSAPVTFTEKNEQKKTLQTQKTPLAVKVQLLSFQDNPLWQVQQCYYRCSQNPMDFFEE